MSESMTPPWLKRVALQLCDEHAPEWSNPTILLHPKTVQVLSAHFDARLLVLSDTKHVVSAFLTPDASEQLRKDLNFAAVRSMRGLLLKLAQWRVSTVSLCAGTAFGAAFEDLRSLKHFSEPLALQLAQVQLLSGSLALEQRGEPQLLNADDQVRAHLASLRAHRPLMERLAERQFLRSLPDVDGFDPLPPEGSKLRVQLIKPSADDVLALRNLVGWEDIGTAATCMRRYEELEREAEAKLEESSKAAGEREVVPVADDEEDTLSEDDNDGSTQIQTQLQVRLVLPSDDARLRDNDRGAGDYGEEKKAKSEDEEEEEEDEVVPRGNGMVGKELYQQEDQNRTPGNLDEGKEDPEEGKEEQSEEERARKRPRDAKDSAKENEGEDDETEDDPFAMLSQAPEVDGRPRLPVPKPIFKTANLKAPGATSPAVEPLEEKPAAALLPRRDQQAIPNIKKELPWITKYMKRRRLQKDAAKASEVQAEPRPRWLSWILKGDEQKS